MYFKVQPSVLRGSVVKGNVAAIEQYANCRFFDALNKLQPFYTPCTVGEANVLLDFGHFDLEATRHILQVSELQEDWAFKEEDKTWVREGIEAGISLLNEVDPEIAALIPKIVGRFLIARARGFEAGSISDMIGTIWLNPKPDWKSVDYADRILHEYVHQCLFLHEMTSTLFSVGVKLLAEEEASVTSAILRRKRGLDKAYHSAFVSFVLAQLYRAIGDNSRSASFADGHLEQTIVEIFERKRFLTSSGVALIEELATEIQSFKLGAS